MGLIFVDACIVIVWRSTCFDPSAPAQHRHGSVRHDRCTRVPPHSIAMKPNLRPRLLHSRGAGVDWISPQTWSSFP